jgi:hypothetical protein
VTDPVAGHAPGEVRENFVSYGEQSHRRYSISCQCSWAGSGYASRRNAKIGHSRHLQMLSPKVPSVAAIQTVL